MAAAWGEDETSVVLCCSHMVSDINSLLVQPASQCHEPGHPAAVGSFFFLLPASGVWSYTPDCVLLLWSAPSIWAPASMTQPERHCWSTDSIGGTVCGDAWYWASGTP
jgi:hypothetical protein